MIVPPNELPKYLGKTIDDLCGVSKRTRENLAKYEAENQQHLEAYRANLEQELKQPIPKLSVIDYIFLEHQGGKALRQMTDTRLKCVTLGSLLDACGLPRLTVEEAVRRRNRYCGNPARDMTLEQRQAAARKRNAMYGNPLAKLTTEQRQANGRKSIAVYGNPLAKLTLEQRQALVRKRIAKHGSPLAKLTLEQLQAAGKKSIAMYGSPFAKLTLEQRQAARLTAEQKPNGLEGLLIQALGSQGLYVSDPKIASSGEIYYCDGANKRFYRFKDGRTKIPDFKVKAQPKVIELHGDYWHSKEFCEQKGLPDYYWDPEKLKQMYADVGIECRVYHERDLRDPAKLQEIVQEIRAWVKC